MSIFDPDKLEIAEIDVDNKKSYTIVFAKASFSKENIQSKITSYALFHAKAIEDGDIAASLEDVIKVYEDKALDKTISLERHEIYSKMLLDLNFILGNTYSFGTGFTSIFANIVKIFSSLLLNLNSISLRYR